MRRTIFLVLMLIFLFLLMGCKNQNINFDEIEIEAIDRVDIPEGTYSIEYSIEDVSNLIKKHGAVVSFTVTNTKDEVLIVTGNSFTVEANEVYTVVIRLTIGDFYKEKTITIAAVQLTNDVIITFDLNGGTGLFPPLSVEENSVLNLTDVPTKDNYMFMGWYMDLSLTIKYTNQTITKNTTLYAKWEPITQITYTVSYDLNGVFQPEPIKEEVIEGKNPIGLDWTPEDNGYIFLGWSLDEFAKTSTPLNEIIIQGDTTIYAVWEIKKFIVTFNVDDGILISGDEVQEVSYEGSAIAPIYEKEGYTLSWDKEFNSVTNNLEINGIWTIKKFIVIFDGNGGDLISGDEVQEVTYKESAIAPLYLKEHHTCQWDVNFYEVTSDLVVTAIWIKDQFTVTFNGNGGTLLAGNEVVQVEYDETVVAPVYKKEGYILTFDKSLDNIKTDLEINAVWNLYLQVNEFNEADPFGEFILFGEYPQTIKDPSVTINSEVTDLRGYALGSDGFYYASKKGKAFTPHSVFSNGEIIYETITYQFRVEPIKWRILSVSDTEYFIFSTIALEAKQFYESNSPREIGGKTIYANNYEHSDIRDWLNNEFLNLAFFAPQANIILNTTVDNSASSTGGSNSYACNNTVDKIYLPSYKELTKSDYGFDEDYTAHDPNRQIYVTDYARVTGANFSYSEDFYGYGKMWLRSPNSWENYSIRGTYNNGHIGDRINAISKTTSVVPMLRISK